MVLLEEPDATLGKGIWEVRAVALIEVGDAEKDMHRWWWVCCRRSSAQWNGKSCMWRSRVGALRTCAVFVDTHSTEVLVVERGTSEWVGSGLCSSSKQRS